MIHRLGHLSEEERLRERRERLQESLGEFNQGIEMSEWRLPRGQSQALGTGAQETEQDTRGTKQNTGGSL